MSNTSQVEEHEVCVNTILFILRMMGENKNFIETWKLLCDSFKDHKHPWYYYSDIKL